MDPIKPIPTYGQEDIRKYLELEVEAPEFTEEEINYWNSVSPFDVNKKISEMYKVVLIPGELSINKLIGIFIEKTENKNRNQIINRFPERVCKLKGSKEAYWLFLSPIFNNRKINLATSIENIEKETKKYYKVSTTSCRLPSCVEIVFCTLMDCFSKKTDLFDKKFILCKDEIKSPQELENEIQLVAKSSIYNEILPYSHVLGSEDRFAITMIANKQNQENYENFKPEAMRTNHILIGLFQNKINWLKTSKFKLPDLSLVWDKNSK